MPSGWSSRSRRRSSSDAWACSSTDSCTSGWGNKFAAAAQEIGYRPRAELDAPELARLVRLDDAEFRRTFSGSPIKRIGRGRFVRNVLYAIGNSGTARLGPAAAALAGDPDPVVAEAARWALDRLSRQGTAI
jgi:epoxyqueuosine reductase